MHINKEAKEKTSQNRPQRQKNLIDFSKTGQMLELFGTDFLFRHEKKIRRHKLPSVLETFQGRFPVSVKSLLLRRYSDPHEKRGFFS